MAKPLVYIDGQSGTTGLQIQERLSAREDIELIRIADEVHRDPVERKKIMNQADLVFFCLPDAAKHPPHGDALFLQPWPKNHLRLIETSLLFLP